MSRWFNSFIPRFRLAWLKVLGAPLSCWDEGLFKEVGGRVGETLVVEEATSRRQRLDRGRILALVPREKSGSGTIKVQMEYNVFTVKLEEEPTSVSYRWITNFLGLQAEGYQRILKLLPENQVEDPQAGNNENRGAEDVTEMVYSREKNISENRGRGQWIRKLEDQNFHKKGKGKDNNNGEEVKHFHIELIGDKVADDGCDKGCADKGKGSWVGGPKMKPMRIQNQNVKLIIDEKKRNRSRCISEGAYNSSSSDSEQWVPNKIWKGECSFKRNAKRGRLMKKWGHARPANCPSARSSLEGFGDLSSDGPNDKLVDQETGELVLEGPKLGDIVSRRDEVIEGLRGQATDQHTDELSSSSGPGKDDSEEHTQNRGFDDLDKEDGVQTSLRGRSTSKKMRNNKGVSSTQKNHNMVTRSPKNKTQKIHIQLDKISQGVSSRKTMWNIEEEIAKVIEKRIEMGRDRKTSSKKDDHANDNKETWNIKEEVTEVIEMGVALGFDFNGKENEMSDIIASREAKDETRMIELGE
ncbi:hypothetical protein Dsin_024430 [Dipteronia sinensis]|uniref:DUF4283 domain-containing protein n=1 Tax=Dipteronia sinensis TaxID=43782 RepID=A0AAD9ZU02_9ROSI|nr:hypothetical protein Dsin_024430 [Dipteronia sinensis]